nr:hypothetical protein [Ardenticatena sp.]
MRARMKVVLVGLLAVVGLVMSSGAPAWLAALQGQSATILADGSTGSQDEVNGRISVI